MSSQHPGLFVCSQHPGLFSQHPGGILKVGLALIIAKESVLSNAHSLRSFEAGCHLSCRQTPRSIFWSSDRKSAEFIQSDGLLSPTHPAMHPLPPPLPTISLSISLHLTLIFIFWFLYVSVVFHDKYQSYKYEKHSREISPPPQPSMS